MIQFFRHILFSLILSITLLAYNNERSISLREESLPADLKSSLLTSKASQVQESVQLALSGINEQDLDDIEKLFQTLIFQDHFSYTLEGIKPVSLSGDFILTPWENTLCGSHSGGLFWKRWEIWKKYQKIFSIRNFLFIEEISSNVSDIKFLIFINANAFLKEVYAHKSTFEKILGYKIVPEEMLEKIASGSCSFQSLIKNSEILWGILLGYGQHNARLYSRREDVRRMRKKYHFEGCIKSDFPTLEEEENYLWEKLQQFDESENHLSLLNTINFAADKDHIETRNLVQKYNCANKKIYEIYNNPKILETALIKLTE